MRGSLVIAVLLVAAPTVEADDRGFYIGGGWGGADYNFTTGDFDDGSITSGQVDSEEIGWKVFGGFRFGKHFSVETGYVDMINDFDNSSFMGISDGTGAVFTSIPGGPVSVNVEPTGYFAEGVGSIPLGKRFAVFGKVGVLRWEATTSIRDLNGERNTKDSGTDMALGAGVEYRFGFGLALRAEWERFNDVAGHDVDLATGGISFTF